MSSGLPTTEQLDRVWHLVTGKFDRGQHSIHGPHWRRVERNGLHLATRTDVSLDVVRLFALFHDGRQVSDDWDAEHGALGTEVNTFHHQFGKRLAFKLHLVT